MGEICTSRSEGNLISVSICFSSVQPWTDERNPRLPTLIRNSFLLQAYGFLSLSLSGISLSSTDLEVILRVRLWMTSILPALPVLLWPTLFTWIPFPFDDTFAIHHGLFSSSVCPSLLFRLSPFFLSVPNILRRKGERHYGGGLFSIRLRSGVLCDHRSE